MPIVVYPGVVLSDTSEIFSERVRDTVWPQIQELVGQGLAKVEPASPNTMIAFAAKAGAIKGAPIEVIAGPQTGLPLPAQAEIIFEGHLRPMSEALPEGPFGEFTGYYGRPSGATPYMRVDRKSVV